LLITKSEISDKANRERPRAKPLVNPRDGETARVERLITKHNNATARSAFLNDGRKNIDE
jgi:hypothetical protein